MRIISVLGLLFGGALSLAAQDTQKSLNYERDIEPIIFQHCMPCHAVDNDNESRLHLDSFDLMMKGGKNGIPVVAGKSENSILYTKLLPNPKFGRQMPPRRKKLSQEELKLVKEWIEQGAKGMSEPGMRKPQE